MARRLLDEDRISDNRCKKLFWDGLDKRLRRVILGELGKKKDRVPSVKKASKAARKVLEKRDDIDTEVKNKSERDRGVSALKAQLIHVRNLVAILHQVDDDDVVYATAYAQLILIAPAVAEMIPLPVRWSKAKTSGVTDRTLDDGGRTRNVNEPDGRSGPSEKQASNSQRAETNSNNTRRATAKRVTCEASVLYTMKRIEEVKHYRS